MEIVKFDRLKEFRVCRGSSFRLSDQSVYCAARDDRQWKQLLDRLKVKLRNVAIVAFKLKPMQATQYKLDIIIRYLVYVIDCYFIVLQYNNAAEQAQLPGRNTGSGIAR